MPSACFWVAASVLSAADSSCSSWGMSCSLKGGCWAACCCCIEAIGCDQTACGLRTDCLSARSVLQIGKNGSRAVSGRDEIRKQYIAWNTLTPGTLKSEADVRFLNCQVLTDRRPAARARQQLTATWPQPRTQLQRPTLHDTQHNPGRPPDRAPKSARLAAAQPQPSQPACLSFPLTAGAADAATTTTTTARPAQSRPRRRTSDASRLSRSSSYSRSSARLRNSCGAQQQAQQQTGCPHSTTPWSAGANSCAHPIACLQDQSTAQHQAGESRQLQAWGARLQAKVPRTACPSISPPVCPGTACRCGRGPPAPPAPPCPSS